MGCSEISGGVCWIFVTHLHNVIIKEQPEAVALHDGDVVPTVGATAGKEKKKELQIYYPGVTALPKTTSALPAFPWRGF